MKTTVFCTLSYRLFLIVLVFTPLAFGTVENWSFMAMETLTAAAFLFMAGSRLIAKEKIPEIPGILPLMLLLGLILLQLLPLPAPLVKLVAPATYAIYRPILEAGAGGTAITLSLNPKATLLLFCTLASYAVFYVLTVQLLTSREKLQKTVVTVTVLGSLVAVEAILQKLLSPDAIYWLRPSPANASPVGPWVYSNHFAGFMEMVFPLVVALFLFYKPQVSYDEKLRDRIINLFTMPGANSSLLLATGAVLIAVSILLSLSRGGIVTLCLAFLFFTAFTARTTRDRRTQWAVLITVAVILIFTWLGWQPVMDEFGRLWGAEGLNTSGRLPVYLDTMDIIRTFPLLGTGAGTFIHVFPAFRSTYGEAVFDHAHNDYLELAAESGIIGLLLCTWFVLAVFLHAAGRLLQRRERYSILIACGSLTGMLALLLHSLVDFQMYNGANGLYFFFLCGLAVSGANTRLRFRSHPTLLRPADSRFPLSVACLLAVFLLAGTPYVRTGIIQGQNSYAPVRTVYVNPNIPPAELERIHRITAEAWRHDPLETFYPYRLGNVSMLLHQESRARKEFTVACLRNPMAGAYIQQLGLALPAERFISRKDLLAAGIQRDPLVAERYLLYCDWLLLNGQQNDAFDVLRAAIETIPSAMDVIARYIRDRRFTDDEISRILPSLPHAWHAMGRILEPRHPETAVTYYLKTLDYLDNGDIRSEYFIRLHSLYVKLKEEEKALGVVRKGVEYLADDPWFRIQLGNYYLSQGIEYRAIEEFRTALRLDPDNKSLVKKLWELEQGAGGG